MRDSDAFSRLYEAESGSVLIFLTRRTFDAEVAIDLTAETFAIALDSWRALKPLGPEQRRAWLFTVAQRRLNRYTRRSEVERRILDRLGLEVPTVSSEDIDLIERQAGLASLRQIVAEQTERLSDEHRRALQLRVVEGRSYDEVAHALGISQQSARARVSRALRRLRVALEPFLNELEEAVS